jgi:hypothetical protein
MADVLATHLQNFYIACGTAIPVFFVALAVQLPPGRMQARGFERRGVMEKVDVVEGREVRGRTEWTLRVELPTSLQNIGLILMLAGELACLFALLFDNAGWLLTVLAASGLTAGALFVVASISPNVETAGLPPDTPE